MLSNATALMDRTVSAASELGHGRVPHFHIPAFGPHREACVCWHLEELHHGCLAAGCVCRGEFRRPLVYGWLTVALAVLRGGR